MLNIFSAGTSKQRCVVWFAFGLWFTFLMTAPGWTQQNQQNQQAQNQPQAPTQEDDATSGLDARIEGPVDAVNVDLQQILSILQEASGLQMVMGQDINTQVTFSLTNPSVREVLDTVLPANGLDYTVTESGVVRIDTQERIAEIETPDVEVIRRIFQPEFVDVTRLQGSIEGLLSENGRVFMDPDTNQIIVEDIPPAVESIQQLILSFDVQTETRRFNIRFGNAAEIADQLVGIINPQEGELIVDFRNNSIIVTDTPERVARAAAIIEQLDVQLDFATIPLAFALPEDILPLAEGFLTENGFLDFDPRTSRIFVQDIPSVIEQIRELVNQLDIPTQQVYIEADVVQVNLDRSFNLGARLDVGSDIGRGGDPSAPGGIGSATGSDNAFFSFDPFLSFSGDGLTLLDVSRGNYRLQLDAMVEKRQAEIIASPRLMVQDAGVGSFTLGSQEPFAVRQQQTFFGGSGGDFFTQQFREVGTTLVLEVFASEAGYVEMFISVEDTRSRRVQLANIGDGLAIDGSFIDTVVTVKSGRTIVLGGIINRSHDESRNGVPVLSSIPLIGNLFRNKSSSSSKQKLLVFLTPKIANIDDPYDFAQVDNTQRIQELQQRGATGFADTQVDESLLDWSNERQNEQAAIEQALSENNLDFNGSPESNRNGGEQPSLQEQLNSGIIRQDKSDDPGF